MRAGVVAGVVAVGLIAVWTVVDDVSLTPSGWLSRALPLLLLGGLLGQAHELVSRLIRRADMGERTEPVER